MSDHLKMQWHIDPEHLNAELGGLIIKSWKETVKTVVKIKIGKRQYYINI